MVVYRGWGPEVFLEPVSKGSARFPYIFFWTVDVWVFKSIHDPTLLKFVDSVLGGHEKGSYGFGPFEMYLDPHIVGCPLKPFLQSVDVRYHYGDLVVVVVVVVVVFIVVVRLFVSGCLSIVDVVFVVQFDL